MTASDRALAPGAAPPDAEAVLALLAAYLATPLGGEALAALRFYRDREELERLQRRWSEAAVWRRERGAFPFAALGDPRPLLEDAAAGTLDGPALVQIAAFAEQTGSLRANLLDAAGQDPRESWPLLAELAEGLPRLDALAQGLRRALLPSGEVSDEASPELARLRRQLGRQRQLIESALGREMQKLGSGGDGALQDTLITVRNERFVLPVRAEARRRAPGVVHGASSSGQTVFVEPLETIELNNEAIRLREAEQAEQRRILRELSRQVAAAAPQIASAAGVCGALELEAAKARFAEDYAATRAEFGEALELRQARHPLLVATLRGQADRAVVPLTLRLAPERMLIVSGPNTGGKTVVLKTVVVAAWMAQCGLPVCAGGAELPVFDALWADIGDVQSIQQNLSTFSSHLVHIRGILEAVTPASLVLLDELGTATNAAEGAALAIEIGAWLRERGCWTLISTHHDSLKAWASQQPGAVANGSVAVDPVTLAPSYQFRMGVPGVSAGLDMAERLGLPAAIIAGARGRLSREQVEAAEYLQKLQENLAAAEEQLRGLEARERAVGAREQALAAHDRTWQQKQMASLRAEMERRFAAFAEAGDRRWQHELEELKASLTAAQQRKLAAARSRQRREAAEAWQAESAAALGEESAAASSRPEVHPGDPVRLRGSRALARVLRRLADGGYEVAAGAVRMQVGAAEIEAVSPPARPAAASAADPDRLTPATLELNLIGLRADEAEARLDKFLDAALLAGAEQVRIVHGAGFGVLRKLVADALRAHPQVARFAHPPQNQGGTGVTLAELK
ncbi:MAG: endonuclease MutS2 [Acidobacteria bacterium]|nr:MAG: endonuclease MutS2 [Acidobacteriota bacterium]